MIIYLHTLYTSELFDVISQHLPTANSYADDTAIYLAFNPNDECDQDAAMQQWNIASVTSATG